jgi:hypothetical protein
MNANTPGAVTPRRWTPQIALAVVCLALAGCGDSSTAQPTAEAPTVPAVAATPALSINGTGVSTETPPTAPPPTPSPVPRVVTVSSPADGATVASPVHLCAEATGADATHFVAMVDPTGQEIRNLTNLDSSPIPPGDRYLHFDGDPACTDAELSTGAHVMVVAAVDANGRPLNPQQNARLQLTVSP